MGVLLGYPVSVLMYLEYAMKSIENEINHKSHSVNESNYIQSFSHPYFNPKFI